MCRCAKLRTFLRLFFAETAQTARKTAHSLKRFFRSLPFAPIERRHGMHQHRQRTGQRWRPAPAPAAHKASIRAALADRVDAAPSTSIGSAPGSATARTSTGGAPGSATACTSTGGAPGSATACTCTRRRTGQRHGLHLHRATHRAALASRSITPLRRDHAARAITQPPRAPGCNTYGVALIAARAQRSHRARNAQQRTQLRRACCRARYAPERDRV